MTSNPSERRRLYRHGCAGTRATGICGRALLLACLTLLVARPPLHAAPQPPSWWHEHHQDDTDNLYVRAGAERQRTEEDAVTTAYELGLRHLQTRVISDADIPLRGTKIAFKHTQRYRGAWYAWVLVTLPRAENERILQAIAEAEKLFAGAAQERDTGDSTAAAQQLRGLLARYPVGAQSFFDSERAAALLAEMAMEKKDRIAAVAWYQAILDDTADPVWREKAKARIADIPPVTEEEREKIFWRRTFQGRDIGLVCVSELDGAAAPWKEMYTRTKEFLQRSGAASVDRVTAHQPAMLAAWSDDGELAERARPLPQYDITMILVARGRIIEVPQIKQFAFNGSVETLLLDSAGQQFALSRDNLIGNRMQIRGWCMDALARTSVDWWAQGYREYLDW